MRLQRSVEPFDDIRLGLVIMNGEMVDTMLLQQTPHGSVEELQTFVCLQGCRRDVDQQSFHCRLQRRRLLVFSEERTRPVLKRRRSPSTETRIRRCLFFSFVKSTRSACYWWLRPPTMTRRLLNRILTGLCKVYASCSDNHCLMAFTGARVTRLSALTPP